MVSPVRIPFGALALDGILMRPTHARWLFVMAHGAGAGMEHPFFGELATALAEADVATLRFQFPYMQAGRRLPDRGPVLMAALVAVLDWVDDHEPSLPIFAGGKSMGGRMTSLLMAERPRPRIKGLIFLGFPLHPAKKPSTLRAAHLKTLSLPMLFLQGTRDALADRTLMEGVCRGLTPQPQLAFVEGADHGFGVLRSSGRTDQDVRQELIKAISHFCANQLFFRESES